MSPNAANSPKVQRRQNRTRQQILQQSARLFVKHGFENVSVEDIITAADIGRSSFYRFFANREEVLSNIIQPFFEQALEDLRKIPAVHADEIMDGIVDLYLGLWERDPDALRVASTTGGVYFYLFDIHHHQYREILGRLLQIMEANGLLLNGSAQLSARLIARLAVPMLEIYSGNPGGGELFRHGMRGLLLSPRRTA
jgi:AcrR family transcriptional regulator